MASSKEVLKYISELGISKVTLRVEDIEAILVCISSIDLQNRQIPIEIVKLRAEVIFGICKELYYIIMMISVRVLQNTISIALSNSFYQLHGKHVIY